MKKRERLLKNYAKHYLSLPVFFFNQIIITCLKNSLHNRTDINFI